MPLEQEEHILLSWGLRHELLYETAFSMCLVNNTSSGTEKTITGEKSLPTLTAEVLRRQAFGWVIK